MTADDLVAFLRARLDERQRVAEDAATAVRRWPKSSPAPWDRARLAVASMRDEFGGHARRAVALDAFEGRESPAEVLADVAAKRAILDLHAPVPTARALHEGRPYRSCPTCDPHPPMDSPSPGSCATLRLLVQPHADHPECHPSWARPVTPASSRSEYPA